MKLNPKTRNIYLLLVFLYTTLNIQIFADVADFSQIPFGQSLDPRSLYVCEIF